jgi:uncharacterized protein (DUF1499 family)
MNWKAISLVACGVALLPIMGLAALSALARRPANLGVVRGRLAACPNSPNCVCTQADDPEHRIEPIAFSGSPAEALGRIKAIVNSLPRTRTVSETDDYLHVEFTSPLFRFVDDVEFLIDEKSGKVQFRSASRTGRSDLGVNRRRMEAVAAAFKKSAPR